MKFALVFVTLLFGLVNCRFTGKIINGERAELGQFPWQVGVFFRKGTRVEFCGGALISDQWVLTAGHCVLDVDEFRVILGTTLLYDDQSSKIYRNISTAIPHPDYDTATNHNDLGLIQLSEPVDFNEYISPIRLTRRGDILEPGTNVTVSGWGTTEDELRRRRVSPYLMYVHLYTISNEECAPYFDSGRISVINDDNVCTSGADHYGFCQGDSGGPLYREENGTPVHVAIVSFTSARGCLSGYPNGYIRTEPYLDWIEEETDVSSHNDDDDSNSSHDSSSHESSGESSSHESSGGSSSHGSSSHESSGHSSSHESSGESSSHENESSGHSASHESSGPSSSHESSGKSSSHGSSSHENESSGHSASHESSGPSSSHESSGKSSSHGSSSHENESSGHSASHESSGHSSSHGTSSHESSGDTSSHDLSSENSSSDDWPSHDWSWSSHESHSHDSFGPPDSSCSDESD